ncbi:MAG: YlmH/Sll1252 family protein [Oscillospiraceae bacterium]
MSRIEDMAEISKEKYLSKFSFFLDEHQLLLAESLLKSINFDNFLFWGGFPSSKRKVLGTFAQDDDLDNKDFPIIPIKFSYRKIDKLAHKDFLGALMSYGIKRETIGDILVDDGETVVFAYASVSNLILSEIDKIGSVGVKTSVSKNKDFIVSENFIKISGFISSLRVDCIVSLAVKLSREKAASLIKSSGVDINHEKTFEPDKLLQINDVFSIRGYGKFVFLEIGGQSKKNRIYVSINKYI